MQSLLNTSIEILYPSLRHLSVWLLLLGHLLMYHFVSIRGKKMCVGACRYIVNTSTTLGNIHFKTRVFIKIQLYAYYTTCTGKCILYNNTCYDNVIIIIYCNTMNRKYMKLTERNAFKILVTYFMCAIFAIDVTFFLSIWFTADFILILLFIS